MERHIRESNLIEGIDDPEEDKQSMIAWDWLLGQRIMNASVIRRLHKIVVANQKDLPIEAKGAYRTIQVYVGKHVPPPPAAIGAEMKEWLLNYKSLTPKEAHIRFETIHPFQDGNGRTGRLLMWWHERKLGAEPTLILADQRWEYYKWFKGRANPLEQVDIFGALNAMMPDEDEYKRQTR